MATFSLKLPFQGDLLLIIEEDEDRFVEELMKYKLDPTVITTKDNTFSEASSFMYEGGVYVIWLKDTYVPALVHEIIHISWLYCDFFEVRLSRERHELQAYFADYVLGQLLQKTTTLDWTIKDGSKEEFDNEDNEYDEGLTETQE